MLAVVGCVFVAKMAGYVWPEQIRFPNIASWFSGDYHAVTNWVRNQPLFHDCAQGQQMFTVTGGYICSTSPPSTASARIFDTYPLSGGAKESIYDSIPDGSMGVANDLLRGRVDIPRYKPVVISESNLWSANPFNAVYWTFYYYSLRPTISLLSAYEQTGNHNYVNRLLAIDASFFANEARSPHAWSDDHAVAFRALVLTYEWWELRRLHVLTATESDAFLHEISKTAWFLADPNHFQPEMNHGTNESAALLELGVDFPQLPGAATWRSIAQTRVAESLELLFDHDGVLIENSPYYHFYELDKYWQIYQFGLATGVPISDDFPSRLRDMTRYATYILQPNDSVPMLGASLEETIHAHGSFAQLARVNPNLKYVLSEGHSGTPPPQTSTTFPASGQTIIRSGWGNGPSFHNAAYMTFNVGAYRTPHSGLDALGFTLYDNGKTLLPAPGMYSYVDHKIPPYFHGTASHNTVVVDGRDQDQGSATGGQLVTRDGITYQSGYSPLYDGVRHLRTLMMLDKNHFLVVDRLSSATVHTYSQMFHLSPGTTLERSGLTATGVDGVAQHAVSIQQLVPAGIQLKATIGQEHPQMGVCSTEFQVLKPCYALDYSQRSRNAAYTTLVSVGPRDPRFSVSFDNSHQRLLVNDDGRRLAIQLGISKARGDTARATDPKVPPAVTHAIGGISPWSNWTISGSGSGSVTTAPDDHGQRVLRITSNQGPVDATDSAVRADLSRSNLQLRIKVTASQRLGGLTLALSNRDWASSARIELRDSYTPHYNGEWMTISLGRESSLSGATGHWQMIGNFDWGSIDAVKVTLDADSGAGPAPAFELDSIRSIPQQKTGAVVFIFDDGYESIMPAAQELHYMGMPANVAVIGKYSELPAAGHLNIFQMKMLQNQWGWNMVNHTQRHVDAVPAYDIRRNLGSYEQDILDGATFLEQENLNSAPNWLIYPHGTTNDVLDSVVARFYKFARTTDEGPEAYPFGSPLRVKNMLINYPGQVEGDTGAKVTPPAQVIAAGRDALRYHTTVILTFHRIKALSSDRDGYPIAAFRQIVRGLKSVGIPVLTLSQLDKLNGVPEDNRIIVQPLIPSQIVPTITEQHGRDPGIAWLPWAGVAALALLAGGLLAVRFSRLSR